MQLKLLSVIGLNSYSRKLTNNNNNKTVKANDLSSLYQKLEKAKGKKEILKLSI